MPRHGFASKLDADFEVIVVDNSSTDGTASIVQNNYPQVQLIASGKMPVLRGPTTLPCGKPGVS